MTNVAILWHMHQPFYEDLVTREHILPWVRLHGLKDYYGMVALLREFPAVRVTFNLVPSLLVQLEAFAEGRAQDRALDLSLKPAAELTETDACYIIQNFFHAQRQRMIDVYPRYAELLDRRGADVPDATAARAIVRRFSRDDLRDLQVWHKLAWVDPEYHDRDERIRGLVARGAQFSEEDKQTLRRVELEILNRVIPEYRDASARGQIEIAASPFYHPILPLLCDTDVYLRTHPEARRPRQRFVHPEDAAEQLQRAVACHERLFGQRPVGLWPSEGSVSDAMVPLAAAAGFRWMATDEQILARTLDMAFTRDSRGDVEQPEALYAPYVVRAGGAQIACAFRDHALSDLIGFNYSSWPAHAAADDFVNRLDAAGRRYAEHISGAEATIFVILDGENAWEHFEGGGRPFLRALYGRLASHSTLRTVTMREACGHPQKELAGIFPGSWIDANFYIWIGHADDQRGWSQLADAHQAIEAAAPHVDARALAGAREELLIAEGSDWFWWYGDDHSSNHDAEFDDLFRRHLRNVYQLLHQPAPDELFVTNITTATAPPIQTQPTALLRPTLDGEDSSYFEWLAAGSVEIRDTAGAMHQTERRQPMITGLRFGFGREHLYVRVDAVRPMLDLLADGFECSIKFLRPDAVRYSVSQRFGRPAGAFWDRRAEAPHWVERGPGGAAIAAGGVLEVALPLVDLGLDTKAPVSFAVALFAPDGVEVERHPGDRPVVTEVPDERFEARNWTA